MGSIGGAIGATPHLESAVIGKAGLLRGKNVVLIVVDTLRADHMTFGGYNRPTAPFLSRIATEGVVFEKAYSGASWTAPSMASMFTSVYPDHHGVITGLNVFSKSHEHTDEPTGEPTLEGYSLDGGDSTEMKLNRIPTDLETLPEVMKAAGYRTFGVADNPNVNAMMGFARGFDHFAGGSYRGAPEVNRDVLQWSDEIKYGESPFFLYVHYMDPHKPYNKRGRDFLQTRTPYKDGHAENAEAYDSEIRYVDTHIQRLFLQLELTEDTLVIFTSDHGEEFGDHGNSGHGAHLYQELIHVPLMMAAWGSSRTPLLHGGSIDSVTSTLDILPTIRELLDLPFSPNDEGESLAPLLETGRPGGREELGPGRVVFSHRMDERSATASELNVAIRGDIKLYDHGERKQPTLGNLAVEPMERHDWSDRMPEQFSELVQILDEHLNRPRFVEREFAGELSLSGDEVRELSRLGYTD
jgi:arylsulfatase A-like enzyme